MNLPIVIAGFDPTVNPGVPTNSQLLQMVQAAHVASGIGVIYWGQSAPDLVTYPDADTALWGKLNGSNVPTGEFFYWNVTWLPFTITALDGSKITNGTITAAKLSTAGASSGDILYFNGTSWTLAAIVASIGDNTLPIAKIVKPGSGSGQVLYYNGSTLQWYNLTGADIINLLANKSIPVAKLAVGGSRYVLRTKSDLSTVEYAAPSSLFNDYELSPLVINTDTEALTISAGTITLDAETGDGGPGYAVTLTTNITDFNVTNLQSGREVAVAIAQDGTGNRTVAWNAAIKWLGDVAPRVSSAATAVTVVRFININGTIYGRIHEVNTSDIRESAESAYPAGGGNVTVAHGLGRSPRYVRWVMVVDNAGGDAGYSDNDEVDLVSFFGETAGDEEFAVFGVRSNVTNLIVYPISGATIYVIGPTGTVASINTAKWNLKVYYSL
jgi:hypothetical protein